MSSSFLGLPGKHAVIYRIRLISWPTSWRDSSTVLNLTAVGLYIISFFLRINDAAFQTGRWPAVMALEVIALVILAASGWIGGEMAYVHRVGVVEKPEVTETPTQRAA